MEIRAMVCECVCVESSHAKGTLFNKYFPLDPRTSEHIAKYLLK